MYEHMDKSKVAKKAELKKYLRFFFQTIELNGDRISMIGRVIGHQVIGRLDCPCLPMKVLVAAIFDNGWAISNGITGKPVRTP